MSTQPSILVTGAYGLVGAWLTKALVKRGDRVVVLRRHPRPDSALVLDGTEARCTVVHGDLVDPAAVESAIVTHEVDTVFHLAGQSIVGIALDRPLETFEANIRGTWLLLEACRQHDVGRVVVAASHKVYEPLTSMAYHEERSLAPLYPYDVSKACADLICRAYWHTYGVPIAVTRLANVYGGGDVQRSRLVPDALAAIARGEAPVIRSDGSPERDFLYVEDAVRAYLAIAEALPRVGGEAFNAGADSVHSVREVISLLCAVTGTDVEPDVQGQGTPDGEIDRQYVDSTKLRELTGWRPQVGLEEGLRRTVEWYRSHPGVLSP